MLGFLVCLVIGAFLWVAFLEPTLQSQNISSSGSIKARSMGGSSGSEPSPLAFYSDFSGTAPLTSIDWETIYPASSKDSTVYMRNQGADNLALTFSTGNWTPANASDYMVLNWDAGDSLTVEHGEIKPVVFTLSVLGNVTGITSFSFDIVIWYE